MILFFSSSLCGPLGILHLASHNITDKHKRRSYSKQPQDYRQIMSSDKHHKRCNVTHKLQLCCLMQQSVLGEKSVNIQSVQRYMKTTSPLPISFTPLSLSQIHACIQEKCMQYCPLSEVQRHCKNRSESVNIVFNGCQLVYVTPVFVLTVTVYPFLSCCVPDEEFVKLVLVLHSLCHK